MHVVLSESIDTQYVTAQYVTPILGLQTAPKQGQTPNISKQSAQHMIVSRGSGVQCSIAGGRKKQRESESAAVRIARRL